MNKALNNLLDWMDENFNGDLEELKADAFQKTLDDEIVMDLWREIGENTIKDLYRLRKNIPKRNRFLKNDNQNSQNDIYTKEYRQKMNENNNNKVTVYEDGIIWYKVGNEWMDLMDMNKEECKIAADRHDKLAKSNAFERDFLMKVANSLKDGQPVKNKFARQDVINLRNQHEEKELEVV